MLPTTFTPTSLVSAVTALFRLNHYDVDGPLKIHGAEVDLRARSRVDPFAQTIYVEATVEYLDNDKYGKDLTKFVLIREKEPAARLLIIAARGATLSVAERAKESRIDVLTYDDFFAKFQQFNPYVEHVLDRGDLAQRLKRLHEVYEEPSFSDHNGHESATTYLDNWKRQPNPENRWIIVVGDYGTGKTALTSELLFRWMNSYRTSPDQPLPLRIELRDFTKQFDEKGLLHHFLDNNGLGHLSIDFVLELLRSGRIVMLLDGYDEMAQYLHARERRVCLESLARLSAGGARGILTSRPNYFSEAEELQIFELLYATVARKTLLSATERAALIEEMEVDALLDAHFVNRFERNLRDLTPEQTRNLVQKSLADDPQGQAAVLGILDRVFRTTDEGAQVALSGKPVIVTYLLDVVDALKKATGAATDSSRLTEWQVYSLIVHNLMYRDFKRSPEITPDRRQEFLRRLAALLSSKATPAATEAEFKEVIHDDFQSELRRLTADEADGLLEKRFADLRSSATLTRSDDGARSSWRFSHNSLREFLVAEHLCGQLQAGRLQGVQFPVSDAMRIFVASRTTEDRRALLQAVAQQWPSRLTGKELGKYAVLVWEAGLRLMSSNEDPVRSLAQSLAGEQLAFNRISLDRVSFTATDKPAGLAGANFRDAELKDVSFAGADLTGGTFASTILDGVSFRGAQLAGAHFEQSMLVDLDLTSAELHGADFTRLEGDPRLTRDGAVYEGKSAIGLLRSLGAKTDPVEPIYIARHHPGFTVAKKVARNLVEVAQRQVRGLVQRGESKKDPVAAQEFLNHLISVGHVGFVRGQRKTVEATNEGRAVLKALAEESSLDASLHSFFGIAGPT